MTRDHLPNTGTAPQRRYHATMAPSAADRRTPLRVELPRDTALQLLATARNMPPEQRAELDALTDEQIRDQLIEFKGPDVMRRIMRDYLDNFDKGVPDHR